MYRVEVKPLKQKQLYVLYSTQNVKRQVLLQLATEGGVAQPFHHMGTHCILIPHPVSKEKKKHVIQTHASMVERPSKAWGVIRVKGFHANLDSAAFATMLTHEAIATTVYRFDYAKTL
eukprot:718916-Ditylum_brightwellii.AAC.1